jgi:hypothetical protein
MLADPDAFAEVITNIIPIARRARSREQAAPVAAERR